MITILKNEFIDTILEADILFYKIKANDDLSQGKFIELFELMTNNIVKLSEGGKIKDNSLKVLVDSSEAVFITANKTQAYIDKNVFPKLLPLTKKVAYLLSSDFYTRLSSELLMDEDNAKEFNTKYFFDKDEALEWLKQ